MQYLPHEGATEDDPTPKPNRNAFGGEVNSARLQVAEVEVHPRPRPHENECVLLFHEPGKDPAQRPGLPKLKGKGESASGHTLISLLNKNVFEPGPSGHTLISLLNKNVFEPGPSRQKFYIPVAVMKRRQAYIDREAETIKWLGLEEAL